MNINDIIVDLMVIENFAKDIHYTCKGEAAYAKHLLADQIHDGISDFIDELKENVILGSHELPLNSKEYLKRASEQTPEVKQTDTENFMIISDIINKVREDIKNIDSKTRGTASLLDKIGEHLDKSYGLIFLQIRDNVKVNEEVKHDHEAATEKPIDREKFEAVIPDILPSQELAMKYAKDALLVQESTIDKLFKKMENKNV